MSAASDTIKFGPEVSVNASSAADAVVAFTDMTGEPGNATGRRVIVTGIEFFAAGPCQFAVRASDAAGVDTIDIFPRSGGLASVGDGVRYLVVRDCEIDVPAGYHFEWISPTAATARELSVIALNTGGRGTP